MDQIHSVKVYYRAREHGCIARKIAILRLWAEGRGLALIAVCPLILNIRGLFEENPLRKIVGSPWKEG